MINNKRVIAIIPARGGSKRLPRKNVLPLAGKPLIVWSIEAALASAYIDKTIVSTDDYEIAEISKAAGASVPFMRPPELASDTASSTDVVMHVLDYLDSQNDHYDYIMLLQPTSPLRTSNDIDAALELCIAKDANSIISVCETDHSPLWENTLPPDHSMVGFITENIAKLRSQDLPTYYRINGAIYISKIDDFKVWRTFFISEKTYAFIMPKGKSIDIDNFIDYLIAEIIIKAKI
jgi:N-acylneuraminate cytidylyltransferase